MNNKDATIIYDLKDIANIKLYDDILINVYKAFIDKGNPDPVGQLVEYIISGEPLYITNNKGARSMICNYDRYDLLRHIIAKYYSQVI